MRRPPPASLPLFPAGPLTESSAPELWTHQADALAATRAYVVEGVKRILLVGPCGMGKMVLAAAIIRSSTVPVLFVCHLRELIDQCALELAKLGITNIGVIRGDDERENPSASIQLASIQTLARRRKPPAGLVLIDEAHRSLSDQYQTHVFDAYPDEIILGFTASPSRLDGRPMGSVWQRLLPVVTYSKLITKGVISEPIMFGTPLLPSLDSLHQIGGDFVEGELAQVMNTKALVGGVVEHWGRLAHMHPATTTLLEGGKPAERMISGIGMVEGPRRATFCFAVTIDHSMALAGEFERAGARVAHLDGKTPNHERRAMIRDLSGGALDVICNVNVLLEGVDCRRAKCVAHARPTLSLVLWLQSSGRILRPWGGITPLLLDHAGNLDRHRAPHLDRVWSLGHEPRIVGSTPLKICKSCCAYVPTGRVLCPYCEAEFKPGERPLRIPTETDTKLELRLATTSEQEQRLFFDKHAQIARTRGFRPGFVIAKWKEEYGESSWPPRGWYDDVKLAFASDEFWQAANSKREERRRQEETGAPTSPDPGLARQVRETIEAAGKLETPHATPPPETNREELFGDWLERKGIGGVVGASVAVDDEEIPF